MYVCICNAVTDQMIRAAAREGAVSLEDLRALTGCASGCGSCADFAREILAGARQQARGRGAAAPFALGIVAAAAAA